MRILGEIFVVGDFFVQPSPSCDENKILPQLGGVRRQPEGGKGIKPFVQHKRNNRITPFVTFGDTSPRGQNLFVQPSPSCDVSSQSTPPRAGNLVRIGSGILPHGGRIFMWGGEFAPPHTPLRGPLPPKGGGFTHYGLTRWADAFCGPFAHQLSRDRTKQARAARRVGQDVVAAEARAIRRARSR